jgi:hypothetical protein
MKMPVVETYRGVGIHDFQPTERIDTVVKREIDGVLAVDDINALIAIAGDTYRPPEARLLAHAKCEARFELAAERRVARPAIDLLKLRALTVGLDLVERAHPFLYGSILDRPPPPGSAPRPPRDEASRARLERARAMARGAA